MSKFVEFPQTPRVRVSNGIDLATGKNTYVFELVDGTGRNVIADHTDVEKVAALAAEPTSDEIRTMSVGTALRPLPMIDGARASGREYADTVKGVLRQTGCQKPTSGFNLLLLTQTNGRCAVCSYL